MEGRDGPRDGGAIVIVGHFSDNGERFRVSATLRIEPVQPREGRLTIAHEPIPDGALRVSISGTTERNYREYSAGQVIDDVRRIDSDRARRIVELWDRWHLNDMRALCVHQSETWECRNIAAHYPADLLAAGETVEAGPITNGWSVIRERFGERAYPKRGDSCYVCGRNRWDEPTDACPETGYRAGTAWLYEPVPADVLTELRSLFGMAVQS
jgi:hypothetical protein